MPDAILPLSAFLDCVLFFAQSSEPTLEWEQAFHRFIVHQGGRPDDVTSTVRRLAAAYLNIVHGDVGAMGHFLLGALCADRAARHVDRNAG